jgi:mono/diheme cytochrome c family protein
MSKSAGRPASGRSAMSRMMWTFALLAAALLSSPVVLRGADAEKLARGKALLQENCGRCHAVSAVGDSPLKLAPPMRDVYARFAPRELQAELMEGMVSQHKSMPQIDFSEEDAHAILVYLYSLAKK